MSIERRGFDPAQENSLSQAARINEVPRNIEVTTEEKEIGYKTLEIYESRIKRIHPWFIDIPNGTITRIKDQKVVSTEMGGRRLHEYNATETIDLRKLGNERISPDLAKTIAMFKFVEDYLVDYSTEILDTSRNYYGISLSNHQWSNEEAEHGRADGLILSGTGNATEEELYEVFLKQKTREYKLKYKNEPRKSLIYGKLQEKAAAVNYTITADKARKEGAVTTAKILNLVGGDETFHSRGYDFLLEPFIERDPEGTKRDAMEVIADFDMPAEDLMLAILGKREALYALRATRNLETLSRESMRSFLEQQAITIPGVSRGEANRASLEWKRRHDWK